MLFRSALSEFHYDLKAICAARLPVGGRCCEHDCAWAAPNCRHSSQPRQCDPQQRHRAFCRACEWINSKRKPPRNGARVSWHKVAGARAPTCKHVAESGWMRAWWRQDSWLRACRSGW